MNKQLENEKLVERAKRLFDNFYNAHSSFHERCRKNEKLWRGTHWDDIPQKKAFEPRSVTPILFSTLESILSDILDSFPETILIGEEEEYDESAKKLTHVVNGMLRRRGFKKEFRNTARNTLKFGLGIQQVLWDNSIYGGLGDITVKNINPRNFLWDPDCEELQDGQGCFVYSFKTRDSL